MPKIRVFINFWREQDDGSTVSVYDPIDDYLNDISLSGPFVGVNFYGTIAVNKRPDKLFLLKVCRADITDAEWATLANLANVRMLPAYAFDTPTANLKTNESNAITRALEHLQIPVETFTAASTIGGFFRSVCQHIKPEFSDFGEWELAPEEWA